jgi:hypothetical protein
VTESHTCDDAPFGSGVAPGTAISGHLTFDPNMPGVIILSAATSRLVSYSGVAVDFILGSSLVSGNDSSLGALEVDSYSDQCDQFGLTVARGFRVGQVAGLSVDYFSLVLPIVPTRFPDASLPRNPNIFDLNLQYAGAPLASVVISHYASPDLAFVDWPGSRLQGQIRTVKLLH